MAFNQKIDIKIVRVYIVMPVHNEEAVLEKSLESLVKQDRCPDQLVVVDDNSTDNSFEIIERYAGNHEWIKSVKLKSGPGHLPGEKVIKAFQAGFEQLDNNFELVCKFDADIVFPSDYLRKLVEEFNRNPKLGVSGGLPMIEINGEWVFEDIASVNHVRGPVKAYRKQCFEAIDGLKASIGWDTIDVLLARFNGWEVKTIPGLYVKHLKPTGKTYSRSARLLQGKALYRMRYGWVISLLALAKGAVKRRQFQFFVNGIQGYWNAWAGNDSFLVSGAEGKFIRSYRWKNILNKFGFRKNH